MTRPDLVLDVFADLACPWCSVGEAYLNRALAARPSLRIERRWRPFQLQPTLPASGLPLRPFFPDKFGGEKAMEAAFAHVAEAGARAGVPFDFSRLAGAPNTRNAHRVVLLAGEHRRTWETARALFDGYFAHGADLTDGETLAALAASAGVPAEAVREMLAGDRFVDEGDESGRAAQRLGVTGVPFVVVAGRYGIAGAQPAEAVSAVLDRALAETSTL